MKALVITRFGGPEVLELQQVPDAHPAPEQVLVNVEAGGLNFADLLTARGGYAGTPKPPLTAGREFAGREAADNHAGRRVMGYTQWAAFRRTNRGSSHTSSGPSPKTGRRTSRRFPRKFLYRPTSLTGRPACSASKTTHPEPAS